MEQQGEFPGGQKAWNRYLQKKLIYAMAAVDGDIEGSVMLSFTICEDGTVCNVEATKGPELLRKVALKAFQKIPRWKPATVNGKAVQSYRSQPVIFQFIEE
jgi:protein TonB